MPNNLILFANFASSAVVIMSIAGQKEKMVALLLETTRWVLITALNWTPLTIG
jgi:hypothetical protein